MSRIAEFEAENGLSDRDWLDTLRFKIKHCMGENDLSGIAKFANNHHLLRSCAILGLDHGEVLLCNKTEPGLHGARLVILAHPQAHRSSPAWQTCT